MARSRLNNRYRLSILESVEALTKVEDLQKVVWPGDDTEIVPLHLLLAAAQNGGLVIGAMDLGTGSEKETVYSDLDLAEQAQDISLGKPLVGFVFGFPGLYPTPDGQRAKHCSHMMGVHPEHRDQGIGFALKRAQWQMVRRQGLDSITWTYDPLLSRNAYLNIARLGAVCNTYKREYYGHMRDGLNVGLPSDRFQVDWWVNSQRVSRRLGKQARSKLDLAHFLAAGAKILNPTEVGKEGLPRPIEGLDAGEIIAQLGDQGQTPVTLVEIPADFMALKAADMELAYQWRLHSRALLERLFACGYLVTDFVHLPGKFARSFYALSYGESTL